MRAAGRTCQACGYEAHKSSRVVVQADVELVLVEGDVYKAKRVKREPDGAEKWNSIFWRAKKSKKGMTFRQAEGLVFTTHGYYPPRDLPNMPKDPKDWARKVASVGWSELIPRQPKPQAEPVADPQGSLFT